MANDKHSTDLTDEHNDAGDELNDTERQELNQLRSEVLELRSRPRRAAIAGAGFLARRFIGPELRKASQAWFKAKTVAEPFPDDETADFATAIVKRWLRVGLWHLLLASGGVITLAVLIWQGFQIGDQIEQQQAQNELIRSQIKQQGADTLIARRAQLLDTIYTVECRDPKDPETCKPNLRARVEAVLAFVEIERGLGRDVRPNLRRADLRGARFSVAFLDLSGERIPPAAFLDLSGVDLAFANLSGATLPGTNLSGASLHEANLINANFSSTDLSGAQFNRADLRGADLGWANFHNTILRGADLRGSRFNRTLEISGKNYHYTAYNLTPEQLAEACGDETTILPKIFPRELLRAWRAAQTDADRRVRGDPPYQVIQVLIGPAESFEMPETWPCRFDDSGERVPLDE